MKKIIHNIKQNMHVQNNFFVVCEIFVYRSFCMVKFPSAAGVVKALMARDLCLRLHCPSLGALEPRRMRRKAHFFTVRVSSNFQAQAIVRKHCMSHTA